MTHLQAIGFDYLIDLHKNMRSMAVRRALKTRSVTFDKLNMKKWMLVNLKVDRMPRVHLVDRYFQAVKHLGVRNDQQGLDYFLGEKDEDVLHELPLSHQKGYVALAVGAAHPTKTPPIRKWIVLCDSIRKPVVLLGGPADRAKGDAIASQTGNHVFNAVGRFSLNGSAALVKHCDKIITPDTGLMHIASAFGKEIISIWGNTVPEFGMTPYLRKGEGPSYIFERKGLACRPCSKIGYKACPKKHFNCMDHNYEEIAKRVNDR